MEFMAHNAYILLLSMKKPPKSARAEKQQRPNPPKKELSDEALWKAFSSKIIPMSERDKFFHISATHKSSLRETPAFFAAKPEKRTPTRVLMRPMPTTPAPFEHGKAAGLDRKTQKRMRRGQIEVEARLDLHGMIQTEAHGALQHFLERAHFSGKRAVLVITGKGLTRTGEVGVLRQAVPRWLNEHPIRGWIKGFDHAAPADGGEGALYILLRRKR